MMVFIRSKITAALHKHEAAETSEQLTLLTNINPVYYLQ